ncbi:MAG: hypothetical protein JWQ53_2890 [Klenkia sp.]|nr:hypothetical protein [Klenkia sp.]
MADTIPAARGAAVNTWVAGANIEGEAQAIDVYLGGANAYVDMCRAWAEKDDEGFVLR